MSIQINPIDVFIIIILIALSIIGIKNGVMNEFKKTINLFLSIISVNFITSYLPLQYTENQFLYLSSFIIILIFTILILGFIINTIIYNLDSIKIEKNIDRFTGALSGIIRGILIINILIITFELFPIHKSSKINILSKLNQESILFNFTNKIKSILID